MSYYGEGTWEVEIDGVAVFNASDAEGVPVGTFASKAEALGAQRETNVKKLLLKKMPPEYDDGMIWSCEVEFADGAFIDLFAEWDEGEWLVSENFDDPLNERQLRSSKPI